MWRQPETVLYFDAALMKEGCIHPEEQDWPRDVTRPLRAVAQAGGNRPFQSGAQREPSRRSTTPSSPHRKTTPPSSAIMALGSELLVACTEYLKGSWTAGQTVIHVSNA